MVSRTLFSFILIFSSFCLFNAYRGFAQKPQALDAKTVAIDSERIELGQDGIFSKVLMEKLSEEQLYSLFKEQIENQVDLMEARMNGEENLLEAELKYYKESGIPRFLTPKAAIWSSILAFLTIIAVVAVPIYFRHKKNLLLFDTINAMVAKGVEIPSELLVPPKETKEKRSNLANGILLLVAGLGIGLFFLFISGLDNGIWSIGLIPLLIGIGYIIIWRMEEKQQIAEEHSN
jgi:hypothetical protein